MPDQNLGVSQAAQVGVRNFQDSAAGAVYGAQSLAAGVSTGTQRLVSDVGRMMPPISSPTMHPYMQVRHGMYAHEMSLSGDVGAMFGVGVPETTTAAEFQELAARDLGNRVGQAAGMSALYGGSALASWHAGGAAIGAGWRGGKSLAQGSRFAKNVSSALGAGRAAGAATGALGVAGGLAGASVGLGGFMAVEAGADKIAQDVRDRQDVMNFLEASSFRYATGSGEDIDERFGAGFNREARAEIASKIKDIDLQDSAFNMDDLKGVLESGTEMGMFRGARDAEEFGEKFKDLTDSLKKVTRTLHTSLQEGMQTIRELKDQGFGSSGEVSSALMTADVLGTASGRTAAEMLSVGRQGAEMVRGTGIGMSTGSTMLQNISSMTTEMRNAGDISGEMVRQAGGIGQLSQDIMASNIGFMRTGFGRGAMLAASTEQGGLDLGRVQQIASGEASLSEMAGMGQRNVSDPASFIRNVVNREKNMRKLGEEFGDMGIQMFSTGAMMSSARELTQNIEGLDMETAMRFQMRSQGMQEPEIQSQLEMMKNADDFRDTRQQAMRASARRAQGEIVRERLNLGGRTADFFDRLAAPVSEGVTNMISGISGRVTEGARNITDRFREYMSGIRMVDREAVTETEAQRAVLTGTRGGVDTGSIYGKNIFTNKEVEDFSESERYEELRGRYLGRENSAEANNAGDIDEYSQAITGRSFGNLTKDEKMYVKSQARVSGRDQIESQIDTRQRRSEQALRNKNIKSVEELMDEKKAAQSDVESARSDIIQEISSSGELSGTPIDAGSTLEQVVKTEEGKEKFDRLVQLKTRLDKRIGSIDKDKMFQYTESQQKSIRELENLKTQIAGKMREQGPSGEVAANLFLKNFEDISIHGAGENLRKAQDVLEERETEAEGATIFQTAAQRLSDIKATELEEGVFGIGGERSEFKRGVGKVRELLLGKRDKIGDISRIADLAEKTQHGGLSRALRKATRIDEPIEDMDRIRRTLDVGDKIKDETIKQFLGKDEALSKEELLKFEIGTGLSDKTGTSTAMQTEFEGGQTGKLQRETMKDIVDTQNQIANITEQLESLADRLERKTGTR